MGEDESDDDDEEQRTSFCLISFFKLKMVAS